MKAFILAAGYGERLKPLTDTMPKPLVPVRGVPAICYSLALLKKAGIKDAVCNLHYRADDIVAFFREHGNFGFNIEFSFEEQILGTGGGVKKCQPLFSGDMVLINSDIITDLDVTAMIDTHRANDSPGTVAIYPSEGAGGTVSLSRGRVADFRNFLLTGIRPTHDYLGAAVLGPLVFKYLIPEYSSIVYTGYTGLIAGHRLDFYEHRGFWQDIGSIDSYRLAEERLGDCPSIVEGARKVLSGA